MSSIARRVGLVVIGLASASAALAQAADAPQQQPSPPQPGLRINKAMLQLDYQVVRVAGDEPIDLKGLHVLNQVADGVYVGAGLFAPLLKGVYGGFTAYDISLHLQRPLSARVFATAGLSLGGGAGGRSVENAKALSGTGGFYKAYAGLGYDLGPFTVGLNVSKMRFRRSAIDGTQANLFLQVPYEYLSGAFARHGQRLSPEEAAQAAAASSERMLTVVFDNFRQIDPQGTYKGGFNVADLQFAQFFARDSYWYAGLGVGWRGLPLYNHVMGGVGQRVRLTPRFSVYGQLGVGSGGYAPERIDTDAGLVVYPRVAGEWALNKELGLSLSAGYLAAPLGSSKNWSVGLALTRHFGGGSAVAAAAAVGDGAFMPNFQAYRVGLFQQRESSVRFIGTDRGGLNLVGIQAEAIVDARWYIPLQASVATSTYLGYPGYGELLAGIGVQSGSGANERLQAFAELMAGTNVHGLAVKAGAGLRVGLGDSLALRVSAGHIQARSAAGNRFRAHSVSLGLDYAFSLVNW